MLFGVRRVFVAGWREVARSIGLAIGEGLDWDSGMFESFVFIAFFAMMPIMTGIILWLAAKQSKKTGAVIEGYARELGLGIHKRPPLFGIFQSLPQVVGSRHGRDVRIYQFQKGSGKNSQTWCALTMGHVPGTDLHVKLSGQGAFTKIRSFFGAQEIEVEGRAFNDRWFIETNDPGFLKAALFGKVCGAIDATQPGGGKPKGRFELEDGAVRYEEMGGFSDADRRERLRLAMAAAQELLDVASVHADQGGRAPASGKDDE